MFDRGVQARVSKAAPFLALDSDPYPVLLNGQIDWVQDAYTTTDNYPYAQNADTSAAARHGSGLNQNFNYVRNSVKVLVNAYTGKMTFYVMDPSDPIIQTYEKAFPGMFTPASKMSARAAGPPPLSRGHLRRPGHHLRQVPHHQRAELLQRRRRVDAVAVARVRAPRRRRCRRLSPPTPRASRSRPGSWSGWPPSTRSSQVPGQSQQSFNLLDAFVPISGQSQIQTLSGFMIAGCDPGPLRAARRCS